MKRQSGALPHDLATLSIMSEPGDLGGARRRAAGSPHFPFVDPIMHPLSRRGFLAASAAAIAALPTPAADEKPKKKKLILLPGRPSHGPGAHEFNAGAWILNKCLEKVTGLEVV